MFELDSEQRAKLAHWVEIQDAKVYAEQRERRKRLAFPNLLDGAYYGASGGGYSYIFTPTSLGVALEVRNNITKETIDLTQIDLDKELRAIKAIITKMHRELVAEKLTQDAQDMGLYQ